MGAWLAAYVGGRKAAPPMTARPSATLDFESLDCRPRASRRRKAMRRRNGGGLLIVERTDPLASIEIPYRLNETGDGLERQGARDDAPLNFNIGRRS